MLALRASCLLSVSSLKANIEQRHALILEAAEIELLPGPLLPFGWRGRKKQHLAHNLHQQLSQHCADVLRLLHESQLIPVKA